MGHQGRMGSRHLGIMGLNGCFEFRNQAPEPFQMACVMCIVENPSLSIIVYAPLAILSQKRTGLHSQVIDVTIISKEHIFVRRDVGDGTGE